MLACLLVFLALSSGISHAKQGLYQGVVVGRHVPLSLLSEQQTAIVLDNHYRLVCQQCQTAHLESSRLREAVLSTHARIGSIAGLAVSVPYLADTTPAPGSDSFDTTAQRKGGFTETERAASGDFSSYSGLEYIVRIGITRDTQFPDIGAMEWTYNRMLETLLKHQFPHDLRALLTHFDAVPSGVAVLKFIPLQSHYADETVIELQGRSVLPFGPRKQNMLLVALDHMELSHAARIVCINITAVQTGSLWLPETGDIGSAAVSLLSISEDPDAQLREVLQANLAMLEERLQQSGLHGVRAIILSSKAANGSLHDQVAKLLAPDDPVRSFDRRVPRNERPESTPGLHAWLRLHAWAGQLLVAFAAIGGGIAVSMWRQAVAHPPQPAVSTLPDRHHQATEQSAADAWLLQDHPRSATPLQLGQQRMQVRSAPSGVQRQAVPGYEPASPVAKAVRSAGPIISSAGSAGSVLPGIPRVQTMQVSASSNTYRDQVQSRAEASAGRASAEAQTEPSNPFDNTIRAWSEPLPEAELPDKDSANAGGGQHLDAADRSSSAMKLEMQRASDLSGWEIRPQDIAICTRPDGSDWLLGSGGYGQVYRGVRDGMQDVAVKMLHYGDDLQLQQFIVEIQLLKSLSFDRNVVQFYGACLHPSCPMLVLEYMEGGDLDSALSTLEGQQHLRWYNHGHIIAMDVARALHFLHSNKVRHGDIKTKNVLLSGNMTVAKLSDVGMARILTSTLGAQPLEHMPGTFSYASPELLLGQPCTEKADVFSLGVLLHALITQEQPVRGRLRDLDAPHDCPQAVVILVEDCMLSISAQRPSARDVFEIIRDSMNQPRLPPRDSAMSQHG